MDKEKDILISTQKGAEGRHSSKTTELPSPFRSDQRSAYTYKKTERILIALHLVTNLVPYNEPARYAIRDKSTTLLSDILSLRPGLGGSRAERINDAIACVCEIISLLRILHAAGFASDMNIEILKRELDELTLTLHEVGEGGGVEGSILLSKEHFDEPQEFFDKGHHKKDKMSFIKRTQQRTQSTKGQRKVPSQRSRGQEERRETVLEVIKDKKNVTIKDISAVVTHCSEKTIQRELALLMSQGIVKKEGERRWSTYSLRLTT